MPQPYQALLVHNQLMTATLERHFTRRTILRVLQEAHDSQTGGYGRQILLGLEGTNYIAEFAVILIDQTQCEPKVWAEILHGKLPLGRILIEYHIERRVEPESYFEVVPTPQLTGHFGLSKPLRTYGRLATIYWNDRPAVQVTEVLCPGM